MLGKDPRWSKSKRKIIYLMLSTTLVVFFLGIDNKNNTTTIQLAGTVENEESDIYSGLILPNDIIKEHAMSEFAGNQPILGSSLGHPPTTQTVQSQ